MMGLMALTLGMLEAHCDHTIHSAVGADFCTFVWLCSSLFMAGLSNPANSEFDIES